MKSYVLEAFEFLNSHPEEGWKEFETSAYIASELKKFNLEVKEKVGSKTGVVAILDTKVPGPILALRADIDALVFEKNGEKYCVHACGHSAHASMVLAAAKELSENPPKKGKVFFIFQPAEEVLGGAESIIESGVIDEIEEIVGVHLRPKMETPMGQATPALIHSSSHRILATIHGKNAHGARPHLGINAVEVAVMMTNAIQSLHFNPKFVHSVKVTKIQGGSNMVNIIPDKCEIGMDLRSESNPLMEEMLERIKETMTDIAELYGATLEFDLVGGVPAAEYDATMTESLRQSIINVLGEAYPEIKTEGGEDFHYYTKRLGVKSAYFGLGCDLTPGLHDPEMTFNLNSLQYGTDIMYDYVKRRLED